MLASLPHPTRVSLAFERIPFPVRMLPLLSDQDSSIVTIVGKAIVGVFCGVEADYRNYCLPQFGHGRQLCSHFLAYSLLSCADSRAAALSLIPEPPSLSSWAASQRQKQEENAFKMVPSRYTIPKFHHIRASVRAAQGRTPFLARSVEGVSSTMVCVRECPKKENSNPMASFSMKGQAQGEKRKMSLILRHMVACGYMWLIRHIVDPIASVSRKAARASKPRLNTKELDSNSSRQQISASA